MNANKTMERDGDTIVAESFLEVRAKLLEIAATFDRIDRGSTVEKLDVDSTSKRQLLREAVEILLSDQTDRAESLQHLFSRTYEADWRRQMGLDDQ